MTETYCGKTCDSCTYKQNLNCEGCKAGPGRQNSGDCEVALCCRGKGHESCETCGFNGNCGTLRRRDNIPEYRQRKFEEDSDRSAKLARRAPFLGKWLWLLFWLVIPSALSGFMTNDNVVESFPNLYLPGQILSGLCSLAYGLILLKLSSEDEGYHKAGLCYLVGASVAAVGVLIKLGNSEAKLPLLVTLPVVIVEMVGYYREVNAHADVLSGVDNILSEKWRILWKWYIGMLGAIVGSIIVVLISPFLGLLVMLAGIIGTIVVNIMKLVYLYRTAKLFREYQIDQV